MPKYALEGVAVDFPYEAYPCQLEYMSKVIQALKRRTNALLESPTGTGKTLCLLCATLAWRESLRQAEPPAELEEGGMVEIHRKSGAPCPPTEASLPRIVYSSRTHSQLAQVMRELRNTSYRPRTSVLASRAQTCLHPDVSQLSGGAANTACAALTSTRSCQWFNRVDNYKNNNPDLNKDPIDIEELVRLGQSGGPCPFFMAKEMSVNADLLFVPYNYLIDERSRKSLSTVEWRDSVVIFDEAHNIEGVCADSFSMDISAVSLASAIQEVLRAREIALGDQARHPDGGSLDGGQADLGQKADDFKMLAGLLKKLEAAISEFPIGDNGITRPGEFIFTILESLNINSSTYEMLCDKMREVVDVLVDQALGAGRKRGAQVANYKVSWLADCIKAIFKTFQPAAPGLPRVHEGFRVHIHRQAVKGNKAAPTLSYWCFNPGISMNELADLGIRSILLTSGTLSPLESFAYELSLPFPVRLENPHVIDPKQVYIGVVSKGPKGEPLNSSYRNRDNPKYKADLGNTIANFARTTPDGLLVFFPSYKVLEVCIQHWKQTDSGSGVSTIWEQIVRHKHPVTEPRGSADFPAAAAEFKAKLDDTATNGAVFFAVCRGKVSEGLDFSDRAGRAVIITGIPYPMKMDPKVRIKQQVLEEEVAKVRSAGGKRQTLGGGQWYSQQALRAVNQALGRVIRHRHDYGAILLCDERFAGHDVKNQLSKWLRDKVQEPKTFGVAAAHLQKFFREMKGNPGLAARDSSTRHSSSNLPSVFCPPPARLPAPDDSTRSVNTAGLAELGRDVLLASLPAAMDTVCTAKRRPAAALFQQLEGSSAVEQRISIHSSASRLLGYLGDGPSEDGPSASRGMSTTRLSADSLLQKTAARDASKSGSSTPADGMTPRCAGPIRATSTSLWPGGPAFSVTPSVKVAGEAGKTPPGHTSRASGGPKQAGNASSGSLDRRSAASTTKDQGKAGCHPGGATLSAGNGDAGINSTRNYPQHQPTSKVLRPSSSNMTQPRTATRPKEAGDSSVPPSTCPRTSDPGTMRRPEAEPNGAGLRSSTDADTPGATSKPDAAAFLARLKRVMLKGDYGKLMDTMKSYKTTKKISLEQLVDCASALLPAEESENFGMFLNSEGKSMLKDKLERRRAEHKDAVLSGDSFGHPPKPSSAGASTGRKRPWMTLKAD